MRIAGRVMILSLLLGYPLAYYLSFHAGKRKDFLYQLVIIPLWVSYLVRGYAWKTILGSDGVLNGLLQYLHITHHPVEFLLYSPFAVVSHLRTSTRRLRSCRFTPRSNTFRAIWWKLRTIWELRRGTHFLARHFPLSIAGVLAGATFAFVLTSAIFSRRCWSAGRAAS